MPSSGDRNFDSLSLARQIIDLNAEVYREVEAKQYERAAALRDQREELEQRLNEFGNPTVVRNVKLKLRSGITGITGAPILSLLEQDVPAVDPELLQKIRTTALPPRWILNGYPGSCRASVAKALTIDALDSPYFHAHLPVLGSTTLAKFTKPMECLAAAIREAAREESSVVWIVEEPAYLVERGLLDVILQVLRVPSTQFVVCLREVDAPFASHFAEIPSVAAMNA